MNELNPPKNTYDQVGSQFAGRQDPTILVRRSSGKISTGKVVQGVDKDGSYRLFASFTDRNNGGKLLKPLAKEGLSDQVQYELARELAESREQPAALSATEKALGAIAVAKSSAKPQELPDDLRVEPSQPAQHFVAAPFPPLEQPREKPPTGESQPLPSLAVPAMEAPEVPEQALPDLTPPPLANPNSGLEQGYQEGGDALAAREQAVYGQVISQYAEAMNILAFKDGWVQGSKDLNHYLRSIDNLLEDTTANRLGAEDVVETLNNWRQRAQSANGQLPINPNAAESLRQQATQELARRGAEVEEFAVRAADVSAAYGEVIARKSALRNEVEGVMHIVTGLVQRLDKREAISSDEVSDIRSRINKYSNDLASYEEWSEVQELQKALSGAVSQERA